MQIDKRAMIEFRFRCWQLEFCQPAASANIEIHRFELRRKNSRNSGDFWISSLFSVYNRLPPFRVPVSKKKFVAASCELSRHCRYIPRVYPARADCKRNAYTDEHCPASRSVRLVDLCAGHFDWWSYLHGTIGWSRTKRLHRVTRLQRITRAGARPLLSSLPLLTKLLTMCCYGHAVMDINIVVLIRISELAIFNSFTLPTLSFFF